MRTYWNVAFRKKKCGSILKDTDTPFTLLKNSIRFWAADPFVFTENGETFIFAELYDSVKMRGTLGYCKYDGQKFSKWKSVISEKYHLSFPYIFKRDGNVYIMPESHQSNQLYLYKAIKFPDKWEKCDVLFDGKKLADSVLLRKDDKTYVFSYEISYPEKNKLYLGEINQDEKVIFKSEPISEDDGSARPGGKFFKYGEDTIRVSQDCKESYGDGLVFSKLDSDFEKSYKEKIIKTISKKDVKIADGTHVYGTHTYNSNDEFEVIDIKTAQPGSSYYFSLPFRLIKKIKVRFFKK